MLSAAWRRLQPYLLLTLLALPALWPLGGTGLPRTNDSLTHLYRAVQLAALVRAGDFFPRWAPDLVHGYGYPVFNFFPYLAHYLVVALHLLGLNFLTAYNAACGLALLASAWFAYRLGREHFGPAAGLVAGVAYAYSSYLLYDTYIRGSLPESLALALLPLVLLYLHRAAQGDRRAIAYAALALAAAILAHHGVMLQAMLFLVTYGLWAWKGDHGQQTTHDRLFRRTLDKGIDERQPLPVTAGIPSKPANHAPVVATSVEPPSGDKWARMKSPLHTQANQRNTHYAPRLIALDSVSSPSATRPYAHTPTRFLPHFHTFTLAFFLTAFFTLPALAEARYAQIARGTGNGSMSYIGNFLTLGEMLALPRLPVDPSLLNPPVVRALPLAALMLAAVTGLRWLYQRLRPEATRTFTPAHTRALAFFAVAALTATLLILPLSRPLWDHLPLLRLTLFPWRLLGPISLFVALAAGALFVSETGNDGHERNTPLVLRPWSLVFSLILLVVFGLPFATPPQEAATATPTLADVARFEVPPDFVGTTTVGEYLPVWVHTPPDTAPNRDQLLAGQPVQRHDAPGAAVQVRASGPTGATYTLDAPAPTTFLYRAFYFPGWRATLDGRTVPITVTHPDGLMTVAIPAGTHTLSLHFGTTPIRVIGISLSILGLIGVLGVALSRRGQFAAAHRGSDSPSPAGVARSGRPSSIFLFSLAASLTLARPLLYDAGRTPLLQHGPRPALPLKHDFATELTLLGADASTATLTADDELRLDLYWMANHPLGIPYGFDVRLVDAAGHTWSEAPRRPRDWRFTPGTDFWPTDQYILDPYLLQPIAGTPPGVYSVRVNVFAVPTLQSVGSLNLLDVTVSAPSRARPCPAETALTAAAAWDGVVLASAGFSTGNAAPGDDVVISPCWQVAVDSAESAPHAGLTAELRLRDQEGNTVAAQPFIPGSPYPPGRWQPGDTLRDQVDLRLPAALDTGEYTWALSVNGTPGVSLGTLAVTAPERTFTPPAAETVLNASLGPLSLHGLSVPRSGLTRGADLPLSLVWQANSLLRESYHVFVHFLAPDGSLAAQSDGVPANWTRRTTGWLPGEYVVDERTLFIRPDLPAGPYTLWAGVYLPATGERLVTDEFGEGRVALGEVVVE